MSAAQAPARIRPETALEAAGYIRVSRKVQAEGHSPEIQREAIVRLAAQEGFTLTMTEEDHERGSKVSREGYQRIIAAVREGTIHAVIVYMHDRWGRDGVEWLARAREFDRLGVPIISVQEGRDEGGLMRFVRAGMAQWYSEQLAQRVRPAREKAAREGKHLGVTPYGFKRIYPTREHSGRYQAGLLVEDTRTSWVVKALFDRYGTQGWGLRPLAVWLNTDPACPPSPKGTLWRKDTVADILRNPAYIGSIRYNRERVGRFETSEPGSEFVAAGQHQGFIASNLFEAVQRKMEQSTTRRIYNRLDKPAPLGAGLFVCTDCGGPMFSKRRHNERQGTGQYVCAVSVDGRADCASPSYSIRVAHAALVAQVRRLRGSPWQPQALDRFIEDDGGAAERAALERALTSERDAMRRHVRLMSAVGEPTEEMIAAFREEGQAISGRIKALEAKLTETPKPRISVPDLREIHQQLTRTELSTVIATLDQQSDDEGLRELLVGIVESARVVERVPAIKSWWARVDVTWTPQVRILLDAALLRLDDEPPRPTRPATRGPEYERWRLARKKAKRRGETPIP